MTFYVGMVGAEWPALDVRGPAATDQALTGSAAGRIATKEEHEKMAKARLARVAIGGRVI
jgi:hypothetical protein